MKFKVGDKLTLKTPDCLKLIQADCLNRDIVYGDVFPKEFLDSFILIRYSSSDGYILVEHNTLPGTFRLPEKYVKKAINHPSTEIFK